MKNGNAFNSFPMGNGNTKMYVMNPLTNRRAEIGRCLVTGSILDVRLESYGYECFIDLMMVQADSGMGDPKRIC